MRPTARATAGLSRRWLAIGPGTAQAVQALGTPGRRRRVVEVGDVYEALLRGGRGPVAGCVVAAPLLRSRPAAQVQALKRWFGERTALYMLGSTGSREHDARLDALQVRRVAPRGREERGPGRRGSADRAARRLAERCLAVVERPPAVARLLLGTARRVSGAGRVTLFVRRGRRLARFNERARKAPEPSATPGTRLQAFGDSLAARALRAQGPLVGWAARGGPRGYRGSAYVLLPLVAHERVEGLLCLTDLPEDRPPGAARLTRWSRLFQPGAAALRAARRSARWRRRSGRDALTGLPNRGAFARALDRDLERANRSGDGLAVALLDVDHFKAVNDTYGHEVGDRVLKVVARRLAQEFRATDMVARYGGEEFAVVLPLGAAGTGPGPARPEVEDVLDRARRRVGGEPIRFGREGTALTVTISGGFALRGPGTTSAAALLAIADVALYQAKAAGRNRIVRGQPDRGGASGPPAGPPHGSNGGAT